MGVAHARNQLKMWISPLLTEKACATNLKLFVESGRTVELIFLRQYGTILTYIPLHTFVFFRSECVVHCPYVSFVFVVIFDQHELRHC